mmetsp:Transcript_18604/g.39960  ORF Transcript_18604/g.39960 Transcript_18604/m.39960 type:complete len:309 (+) Transcript_18604:1100-2026(+)
MGCAAVIMSPSSPSPIPDASPSSCASSPSPSPPPVPDPSSWYLGLRTEGWICDRTRSTASCIMAHTARPCPVASALMGANSVLRPVACAARFTASAPRSMFVQEGSMPCEGAPPADEGGEAPPPPPLMLRPPRAAPLAVRVMTGGCGPRTTPPLREGAGTSSRSPSIAAPSPDRPASLMSQAKVAMKVPSCRFCASSAAGEPGCTSGSAKKKGCSWRSASLGGTARSTFLPFCLDSLCNTSVSSTHSCVYKCSDTVCTSCRELVCACTTPCVMLHTSSSSGLLTGSTLSIRTTRLRSGALNMSAGRGW